MPNDQISHDDIDDLMKELQAMADGSHVASASAVPPPAAPLVSSSPAAAVQVQVDDSDDDALMAEIMSVIGGGNAPASSSIPCLPDAELKMKGDEVGGEQRIVVDQEAVRPRAEVPNEPVVIEAMEASSGHDSTIGALTALLTPTVSSGPAITPGTLAAAVAAVAASKPKRARTKKAAAAPAPAATPQQGQPPAGNGSPFGLGHMGVVQASQIKSDIQPRVTRMVPLPAVLYFEPVEDANIARWRAEVSDKKDSDGNEYELIHSVQGVVGFPRRASSYAPVMPNVKAVQAGGAPYCRDDLDVIDTADKYRQHLLISYEVWRVASRVAAASSDGSFSVVEIAAEVAAKSGFVGHGKKNNGTISPRVMQTVLDTLRDCRLFGLLESTAENVATPKKTRWRFRDEAEIKAIKLIS